MSIKIKHDKAVTADNILNDVSNLNSFVRYLILEIGGDAAFGMDEPDFAGFGVFLDLQNALIKEAIKLGDANSQHQERGVAA